MSIPVISIVAGVALVGGGIGIYLLKNRTNNLPPKLVNKVEKEAQKPARDWNQITTSQEYTQAKTTGKLLPHISYKEDEIADNETNYFLMEMDEMQVSFNSKITEIKVWINDENIFEIEKEIEISDLPFFCFNEETGLSIQDLNFNELTKCKTNSMNNDFEKIADCVDLCKDEDYWCTNNLQQWCEDKCEKKYPNLKKWKLLHKYMVGFLGEFTETKATHTSLKKLFNEWHIKKPTIKITFTDASSYENTYKGKMIKIFHKGYKPEISNK